MVKQLLCCAVLALGVIFPALGQSTSAEITGTVTDQTGAAVPDVAIAAVNQATGIRRETKSSAGGTYTVALLPPGEYSIAAQKPGFRPLTRKGINLQVDQVARIDLGLEVGTMAESVEVSAEAPLLDQATSSLGQVIDQSKITNIPLNGRSSFRLVQLTPGVLGAPSSNGQFGDVPVNTMDDSIISINGGRSKTNEIMIDGVPSTTGYVNEMTTIPSVDATQEFKVQSSNLSAEWGRLGGGVINVSTRSGGNQIHGSLFEFLRNSAFDANEFFNKKAGKDKPPFRMNQFGFALGGPVRFGRLYDGRNKTFFFADYQGTRWRRGDIFIGSVPTALQRAGNFSQTFNASGALLTIYDPFSTQPDPANPSKFIRSAFPGNVIPASRLDPVALNIAGYLPQPNTPGDPFTQLNNYVSNAPRKIDQANYSSRIDHNFSEKERIFGRFAVMRSTLAQPDTFGNVASSGVGANGTLRLYNYSGAFDSTTTISSNTIADIKYGFARFYWGRPTRSFGFDQTTLGLPSSLVGQFAIPLFPQVSIEGYSGAGGGSVLFTGQDTHSLLSSLTHIAGKHNVKFGTDVRLRRLNNFNVSGAGGTYSFTRAMTRGPDPNVVTTNAGIGLASLLLGAGSSGAVNNNAGVSLQNWYFAGYIQDDFRVSNRLTLNLGFRYETESPYTERRNQLVWFDSSLASPVRNPQFPNLNGGLRFAGNSGDSRYVFDWDRNNFAPRAGFAFNLFPKTVLRGGAGLFYAPLEISSSDTGFSPGAGYNATTPFLGTLNAVTPFRTLSNPFPDPLNQPTRAALGASTYLGQGLSVWDPHPATPYIWQWNFDLQQELPGGLLIDAAYTGSRGVKLTQNREFNALNPQYLALGSGLQALVPNPFYGTIPTGTLSQPTVSRQQLLLPYPQYTNVLVVNDTSGNSIYHALNLKVEKRFKQGVNFLFSFTGGKLISDVRNSLATYDNSTNAGLNPSVQNWYNLRAERSLSELDASRSFSFSFVAELPVGKGKRFLHDAGGITGGLIGGWQLSGVTTYRNGFPLILSASVPGGGNRPNSTGRSAELSQDRTRAAKIDQWFDTSAFTIPAPFTFGNVSRTLPDVRGPSLTNVDLALVKNTRIHERLQLQFRAESFNLLNTPHLWLPNTNAASIQFGQISSTTGLPRVNQLALKLIF